MAGINRTTGKATDLITFSRASGGTALRKISYGSELVTNGTFDTDSDWTKGTGVTISSGVATWTASTGALSQNIVIEAGKVYAISFDVLGYSSGAVAPRFTGAPPVIGQNVNSDGSYTQYLVAVSDESLRFDAVGTTSLSIDNISVKEVLFDQPDGTLTLFNHPTNTPRIEYDADGNVKGLLIEEARTNLVTYSNFSGGWIGETQVSLAPNSAISPTGQQDAMVATSSGIDPHTFNFTTVVSGNDYTFTVWLKGVGNTIGRSPRVWMLSNTGGIASVVADTTPLTSEWRRYTSTGTCTGSGEILARIDFDNSGLSASGEQVYAFGAQVEAGSFPTSYIPTSGATATRAADIASISVDNFGYNQKAGSVVVEGVPLSSGLGSSSGFDLWEDYANKISFRRSTMLVSEGNVATVNTLLGWDNAGDGSEFKFAGSFKENSAISSVDGTLSTEDTTVVVPDNISQLSLRVDSNSSLMFNAHIKSIAYYPRRLSNAQLQALTA